MFRLQIVSRQGYFPVHTLRESSGFWWAGFKKQETQGNISIHRKAKFLKSNELYEFICQNAIVKQDRCYLQKAYRCISMHGAVLRMWLLRWERRYTRQIRLIRRFSNITVLYDGIRAGINAALRGIDCCSKKA